MVNVLQLKHHIYAQVVMPLTLTHSRPPRMYYTWHVRTIARIDLSPGSIHVHSNTRTTDARTCSHSGKPPAPLPRTFHCPPSHSPPSLSGSANSRLSVHPLCCPQAHIGLPEETSPSQRIAKPMESTSLPLRIIILPSPEPEEAEADFNSELVLVLAVEVAVTLTGSTRTQELRAGISGI